MSGFTGSAPGKLVVSGEYAVLEGVPALVQAVNRRANARFIPDGGGELRLSAKPLGIHASPIIGGGRILETALTDPKCRLAALVLHALHRDFGLRLEECGGDLHVDSSDMSLAHGEAKLGVGSSAAVAVTLVAGFGASLAAEPFSKETIFKVADDAHREFQAGRGSGIDIAAATYGGCLRFHRPLDRPAAIESVSWPDAWQWIVVGTGKSASTSYFLQRLSELKEDSSSVYHARMQTLKGLGERVIQEPGLNWIDWSLEWCSALAALGDAIGAKIMSDEHNLHLNVARRLGFGYKPSGAGGGDAGFFLVPVSKPLDEILPLLRDEGVHILGLQAEGQGVHVERLEHPSLEG